MRATFSTFLLLCSLALSSAVTTISPTNAYSYGANIGWMDWRGDTNNGAVIGPRFCSGNLYAANVGWISLGSGVPANGVQYQNLSASDYGVNVDTYGRLRGYAYGANIGWIAFEDTGLPAVDFASGNLNGSVWGANVGWISLSNAVAYVQTAPLAPANDLCAGAAALTNGVPYAQDTSTATSTGDPATVCTWPTGNGVWFTYTPFLNGVVTVSTCGSTYDTMLGIYSGACGALTELTCADDNGPACAGTSASLVFAGTAGVTYHILVGGWGSASGNLNIVVTSPSNDQCPGAVPLADGAAFTMSTTNATSAGDPAPYCQPNFGKGAWFTYTAPRSGDAIASTCGSDFDTVLAVYSGNCDALVPVACDDDNGPYCSGWQSSVRFAATAGVTYRLLAGGYGNASGNLRLTVSLVPVLACSSSGGASGGSFTLNWSGNGTLQSATNLTPAVIWTDLTNGGGMWTETMTNPAKFFRIKM